MRPPGHSSSTASTQIRLPLAWTESSTQVHTGYFRKVKSWPTISRELVKVDPNHNGGPVTPQCLGISKSVTEPRTSTRNSRLATRPRWPGKQESQSIWSAQARADAPVRPVGPMPAPPPGAVLVLVRPSHDHGPSWRSGEEGRRCGGHPWLATTTSRRGPPARDGRPSWVSIRVARFLGRRLLSPTADSEARHLDLGRPATRTGPLEPTWDNDLNL